MKYYWINHKPEFHVGWNNILIIEGSPDFVQYLARKVQEYYPGCKKLTEVEECESDDIQGIPR